MDYWLRRVQHAARQEMISIPRPVMRRLGIRRGDSVVMTLYGTTVMFRVVRIEKIMEGVETP